VSGVVADRHRAARGSRSLAFGAVMGTVVTDGGLLVLSFVSGCLAARLLQPEGRGALAAVLFWPQFVAAVGMFSLNEATSFGVARRGSSGQHTWSSAMMLGLILAALTIMAGLLALPYLFARGNVDLVPYSRYYLLALVPAQFGTLIALGVDQGSLKFGRFNIVRFSVQLFYVIGLLLIAYRGRATVGEVVAINGGSLVVVAIVAVMRLPGGWRLPALQEIRELLSACLRFHPVYLLTISANQLDQMLAISLWDKATVGHYAVALTVATSGFGLVGGACSRVLFPYVAAKDSGTQSDLIAGAIRHATLLMLLFAIPLAVCVPILIPTFFGTEYRASVLPALLLLPSHLLVAIRGLMDQLLRGCGKGKPGIIAGMLNLVCLTGLAFPLAKWGGMPGLAIAIGMSAFVGVWYFAFHLNRTMGIPWRSLWGLNRETARTSFSIAREWWQTSFVRAGSY